MPDREKVIDALECLTSGKWWPMRCFGCPYSDGPGICGRQDDLFRDALELLKGQEAVKPGIGGDQNPGGTWWYICPVCQKAVDRGDAYCANCGRAVKWDAAD